MKKHTLILILILSTQILFARRYIGLPDSTDIKQECKNAYEVKLCLRAINAIAHDKTRTIDDRYYQAYKLSQKLCRVRSYKKEGRYACKLEQYYSKKYDDLYR